MERSHRFWLWIERGANLHELISLVVLVPSAAALIVGVVTFFARSPAEAITAGLGVYVVLQIGLAATAFALRQQAGRTPDIDLQPSSGPSDQVRVAVTNRGRDALFRVTGRIVGRKNDPNAVRHTVFSLVWLANRQPGLILTRRQTENVLVAEFEILQADRMMERMGEMRVIEFKAEGTDVLDTTRWSFYQPYQPVLPEVHIELTFRGDGYPVPIIRTYALRPAGHYGPLELVPLEPAQGLQPNQS